MPAKKVRRLVCVGCQMLYQSAAAAAETWPLITTSCWQVCISRVATQQQLKQQQQQPGVVHRLCCISLE